MSIGTRISDMDSLGALPTSGADIPIVKDGDNYRFDLAAMKADLDAEDAARPTSTALAAPTGSSLIAFLQSGTGAAATDLQTRGRETLYVSDFSTAQQAVDAAIARGAAELRFNGGTWALGPLTIGDASDLILSGGGATINITGDMSDAPNDDDHTRTALFNFSGTCRNIRFRGFNFVGDNTLAHKQRVFGYDFDNPPTLSNISVTDFAASQVMIVGVFPGVQGLTVRDFTIFDLVGEDSGQGLGVVTETAGATRPSNVVIGSGSFDNVTRHGIYLNHCDGASIANIVFRNHRSTLFTANSGPTGKVACAISRSTAVSLAALTFVDCHDGALSIDQDSTHTIQDVSGAGITFYQTQGTSLKIGRTANSGVARNIRLSGIVLHTTAAWTDPDIILSDPQDVTIDGLQVNAEVGYTGSHTVISVSENLASYCKRLLVRGVRGIISGTGNLYLVELSDALSSSSGGRLDFMDNDLEGATRLYLYNAGAVSGACANPNIRSDWDFVQDITVAGTPSVAGYNRFRIALGSAGDITDFANGYDEKTIDLFFANGNATLKITDMVLAGAADFTSTSFDRTSLRRTNLSPNPSKWVEMNRAVN